MVRLLGDADKNGENAPPFGELPGESISALRKLPFDRKGVPFSKKLRTS
jgi:hypothetical protein